MKVLPYAFASCVLSSHARASTVPVSVWPCAASWAGHGTLQSCSGQGVCVCCLSGRSEALSGEVMAVLSSCKGTIQFNFFQEERFP